MSEIKIETLDVRKGETLIVRVAPYAFPAPESRNRLWSAVRTAYPQAGYVLFTDGDFDVTTAGKALLSSEDLEALRTFYDQCHDCDADGYTVRKDRMKRLAEIGAVRWCGGSRYTATAFGEWLLGENSSLPLSGGSE